MSTVQILMMLKRDYLTVKKAADNKNSLQTKTKLRERIFKNVSDRDIRQLRTTIVNQPLLTNWEVFTMVGIASIKRDKRCKILKQIE